MDLSKTQKKNAARRAKERSNTVAVFCNSVSRHPLQRATPMEVLTKYGIENAQNEVQVPRNHCAKCRDTMSTFADTIFHIYRPDETALTLHNVVYAEREEGDDFKMNIMRGSFRGKVFEVETDDNDTMVITVKLETTRAKIALPKTYETQGDDLRLTCIDHGMRVVRFTLSNGSEVHFNAIIGRNCKSRCQDPCEWHVLREAEKIDEVTIPFDDRVHELYQPNQTHITVHDTVFTVRKKETVYAGSFHGKVIALDPLLDGGIQVTIQLWNAFSVEPVPDAVSRKLPPKYARVIVLDDGKTRAVRIMLHQHVKPDNVQFGGDRNELHDPVILQ